MEPDNSISIIGAGIAGLSAAIFAAKAGYKVKVYEQHSIPGGLCTAWKRSSYTFDYCVDYFFGTAKNQGYYKLWKELGVFESVQFESIDSFGYYKDSDGNELEVYTDPKKLQKHLVSLSPEDEKQIKKLCKALTKIKRFMLTSLCPSIKDLPAIITSLPTLLIMARWSGISVGEWASQLKSPFLQKALPAVIGDKVPWAGPLLVFGMMNKRGVGYPKGGSLSLINAVYKKARSLGVKFCFNSRIEKLKIHNNRISVIKIKDGDYEDVNKLIVASDVHELFSDLLANQNKNVNMPIELAELFENASLHRSIIQLSLGIRVDSEWNLKSKAYAMNLPLKKGIEIEGKTHDRISIRHYISDPLMAPPGGTVMIIRFESDFNYWAELKKQPAMYRAKKEKVKELIINALESIFPGISSRIEASDISTPISCVRYTSNFQGSTQGWYMDSTIMQKIQKGFKIPHQIPDISNLWMCGQWLEPGGGLPPSAKSGMEAVKHIIRHSKR